MHGSLRLKKSNSLTIPIPLISHTHAQMHKKIIHLLPEEMPKACLFFCQRPFPPINLVAQGRHPARLDEQLCAWINDLSATRPF